MKAKHKPKSNRFASNDELGCLRTKGRGTLLTNKTQKEMIGEEIVDAAGDVIALRGGFTLVLTAEQCQEMNDFYDDAT